MKKIYILALCIALVPMLFAANSDTDNTPTMFATSPVRVMTMEQFQQSQPQPLQGDSVYVCDLVNYTGVGLTSGGTFELAFRATSTELGPYVGYNITHVIWYHYDGSATGQCIIYDEGTPTNPGAVLTTEPYTPMTGWTDVVLGTPIAVDGGDNWFSLEVTHGAGFYPGGCDAGPHVDGKGDWIYFNGSWAELYTYGLDYNWQIIAIVEPGGANPHDVGCNGIFSPPTMVMPNQTFAPQARYRNFGDNQETFDIYFDIDSSGTLVYSETYNITLPSGNDTTVDFPNWTSGPSDGITYTCIGYTILSGDGHPENDTTTQTTVTNSTYWEILDPPVCPHTSSGHSMATVNDGYVWAMRMHPSAGYLPDCNRYDIANNTWDASYTSDPYGAGSYGTANGVNGKIYCIGGTVSWPTGQNTCHIYDVAANSWADGATAPALLLDHAAGVYADRYIITFGNGNWSMTPTNEVYVYDTENDTWATGTSFPGTARGAAAFGVVGDYAVGACGYDATGNYANDYIVGQINPSDPSQITWGAWNTIPGMSGRYRVPSAQDEWNECVWVINGQNGPFADTWSYDPYTDTWTDWGQPKPQPIGNVTPLAVTVTAAGDVGVFAAGGYTGAYVDDNEVFHTGAIPGVSETPGEVGATKIGFAPTMNPVKDYVSISYTIDTPANVTLKVYDHSGRVVRTLVNNRSEAQGTKTVYWNGKDDSGRNVANGVYFFTLEAAGQTATHKVTFVK